MKVRVTAISFAAFAALMTGPVLAEVDDETPIDCSKTDFEFTGEWFEVKCTEFDAMQLYQAYGSAQVQVRLLSVNSTRTADWLSAADFRILGSLAVRRSGIEDNVHSYFEKLPAANWKSVKPVQGFEAAEFETSGGGEVQDCVAFQRYFNRRYDGFSRWLVGVSCSSDGKDPAYRTLAGFSGPGD